MTTEEKAYFDFIKDTHCPYHLNGRKEFISKGAIELFNKDLEVYNMEVGLLEAMGEIYNASIPDAPTSKSKFKSFKIDRGNRATTIYLDAAKAFKGQAEQQTSDSVAPNEPVEDDTPPWDTSENSTSFTDVDGGTSVKTDKTEEAPAKPIQDTLF